MPKATDMIITLLTKHPEHHPASERRVFRAPEVGAERSGFEQ